jgi:exosortase E/protease (VPEID-CTERM system)
VTSVGRTRAGPIVGLGPTTAWIALLVVEALAVTLRFDAKGIEDAPFWWARIFGQMGVVIPLAVSTAVALLVFRAEHLRGEFARVAARAPRPWTRWPWLAAHLVAFAAFYVLTARIFGSGLEDLPHPGLWALAWLAATSTAVALLALAALPARLLLDLLRGTAGAWALATGVGALAWSAGELTEQLWRPLGQVTLWLVHGMLATVRRDAVLEAEDFVVGTGEFTVQIVPVCSGYQGIGLIWVFLAVYLWTARRDLRFPRALWLIPIGTAIIWLCNAVRLFALVLVGTLGAPELAAGGFHSKVGWILFSAGALMLAVVAPRSGWFAARDAASAAAPREESWNPTAAYLLPWLVLVGTTMLTGAVTRGFDSSYPLWIAACAAALWGYRRHYAGLGWSWSWAAAGTGVAVSVAWIALEPLVPLPAAYADLQEWRAEERALATTWTVLRVAGSVLVVPLAEELAFRGYLLRRLVSSEFQDVSFRPLHAFPMLASSLLFGALHGRWVAGLLAGMAFAWVLSRRGRLADAVLAHAACNASIAIYVLGTDSWRLWV